MNIKDLDLVEMYNVLKIEDFNLHLIGTVHKPNDYKPSKRTVSEFLVERANSGEMVFVEAPFGWQAELNDYAINKIKNGVRPDKRNFIIPSDYRLSFVPNFHFKDILYWEPMLYSIDKLNQNRIERIKNIFNKKTVVDTLKKLHDFVTSWKNMPEVWKYWEGRLPNYMRWLSQFQQVGMRAAKTIAEGPDLFTRKDLVNLMGFLREYLMYASDFLMIKNLLIMKDNEQKAGRKIENIWVLQGMNHIVAISKLIKKDILIDPITKKEVPNPNL